MQASLGLEVLFLRPQTIGQCMLGLFFLAEILHRLTRKGPVFSHGSQVVACIAAKHFKWQFLAVGQGQTTVLHA